MEKARETRLGPMRLRYLRWRRIFGPVFFYDLVRASRQGQVIAHRCLYACLLIAALFLAYNQRFPEARIVDLFDLTQGQRLSANQKAAFANDFFGNYIILQFVVILLLTPLYTATAVAEERERRTLDLLFTTDLSNRDIVLGKLASRLGKLLLLLLTGLPILSLLELLGGVEPSMVIIGFLACGMLMTSVGAISIFASVGSRTALGAISVSYLQTFFLALFGLIPCTGLFGLVIKFDPAERIWAMIGVLAVYLILHGLVTLVSCRAAIFDLRPFFFRPPKHLAGDVARRISPAVARSVPAISFQEVGQRPTVPKPPVSDNALLWKEMYVEPSLRAAAGLTTVVLLLCLALAVPNAVAGRVESVQATVRAMAIAFSFISFVIVAISAANRIAREREKQTLDSLLVLPHARGDIFFAKWLASILIIGRFWWWLAGLWLIAAAAGGISVVAIPLLLAASVVYLSFFASIGIWFSTLYSSSLRANLFTLLVVLLILAGPGAIVNLMTSPSVITGPLPWSTLLIDHGLTPASTLWTLHFRDADLLDPKNGPTAVEAMFAAVAGLYLYMAAAILLWFNARSRFADIKAGSNRSRV